ncbi:MAG: hypothetical protein RE469_00615 [Cuniculiplasma divulgatum]|nr:MAG: hypothetical protein RE469_00615 [Cuniculiplasma divulgatum]
MTEEHSDIRIKIVAALTIILLTIGVIVDIILLKLEPECTGILILLLSLFLMYDVVYALITHYEEILWNKDGKVR